MLVIDTYNVLHVTGVLPPDLAGIDVPGLVRLLAESRFATRTTTLVCDGAGSRGSGVRMGGVSVLFSGSDREADDVIETLIEKYAHGGGLSVVSSDKRIRRAARRRRAESIASEAFLEMLAQDHGRGRTPGPPVFTTEIPLDRYSVDHWLREFGIETTTPSRTVPSPARPRRTPAKSGPPPIVPDQRLPDRGRSGSESPADPSPALDDGSLGVEIDPLLRAALEEWRGRLTLDDLDMERWVHDIDISKKYDG
ncbi:MAG: hypothetical protein CMJ31_06330 [Phycisphaerae bacterium]|nr:hypothetical protein [Phycisphaerae bacterium]